MLEGEITHEDNMGNREVLGKEDVQCITTGTGIEHSEFNRERGTSAFIPDMDFPVQKPSGADIFQKEI